MRCMKDMVGLLTKKDSSSSNQLTNATTTSIFTKLAPRTSLARDSTNSPCVSTSALTCSIPCFFKFFFIIFQIKFRLSIRFHINNGMHKFGRIYARCCQQKILTANRNVDLFSISPIILLLASETLDDTDPRDVSFFASRFMRL